MSRGAIRYHGSIALNGTVSEIDSLTTIGTISAYDSLSDDGAISFHGSLVDLGAIMFYGSLEPLATITGAVHTCSVVLSGVLIHFHRPGTIQSYGSHRYAGTIGFFGSLTMHDAVT